MPERVNVPARLLDGLRPEERGQVEDVAALLARAERPWQAPPAGLEQRTLAAVRAAADGAGPRPEAAPDGAGPGRRAARVRPHVTPRSWLRLPRVAFGAGLAAALAAGVLAGVAIDRDGGLPGTPEVEATLIAPGGGAIASATVQKTGIGRVIDFRTDELPILPKGEYYELWFVGPRDRPGRPDRISAGTFHPDEDGRSRVRFAAAVDPALYPGLAVTAEPGDGDPSPSRPDVLRSSPGQP